VIRKDARVTLHYELKVDDEVVESSRGRDPIRYVHGQGEIIPGLEHQLEGLEAGATKTARIAPDDAYGPRRPDATQTVPKSAFRTPDELETGVRVSGEVEGQPFTATVTEVDDDTVTLDLNHPLAGKTLEFDVEIVSVD